MTSFKHFDVSQVDDVVEIRFVDTRNYDSSNYADLQNELMVFVEQEAPQKLLVHFGRIEYCSTAVMNGLIQLREKLALDGRQMKFYAMSTDVHESFRMLKLSERIFDIYTTRDEALAAF